VAAEPFHVWIIEGPKQFAEELPLHKAGLNVVWTDDMQPYRTRKVRILNGAHTSSVLAAYGMDLDTVKAMMDDATASAFLKRRCSRRSCRSCRCQRPSDTSMP